jgi:uncharacterized protein (TIGR00255 family)
LIEGVVREYLRRGTVNVSIRISQLDRSAASKICVDTLRDYVAQTAEISKELGVTFHYELGQLLQVPGILGTPEMDDYEPLHVAIRETLVHALDDLNRMRSREGASMAQTLKDGLADIRVMRTKIEERAPVVLEEYRKRIENRVRAGLADHGHEVGDIDLIREVLLYSDRCDVREELVRLDSHLAQFESSTKAQGQGRRLDFLIQELFRETNTIGSKANDAQIAHNVVSIKTIIEQMRELVQNIE